jgi:hypothetical protein
MLGRDSGLLSHSSTKLVAGLSIPGPWLIPFGFENHCFGVCNTQSGSGTLKGAFFLKMGIHYLIDAHLEIQVHGSGFWILGPFGFLRETQSLAQVMRSGLGGCCIQSSLCFASFLGGNYNFNYNNNNSTVNESFLG